MDYCLKYIELGQGMWFSGRSHALYGWNPGFNPLHHKKKKKKLEGRWRMEQSDRSLLWVNPEFLYVGGPSLIPNHSWKHHLNSTSFASPIP